MNNRFSILELSKQPSNTVGIETMISEALNGGNDEERQKLNLTVWDLPESTSHVSEDRQQYDDAKLMEAFHSIDADVVPESVRRIEKMNPDKPRLLMVTMPTIKDKGQIIKSAWKLNNSNATIKLDHQASYHHSTAKGTEGAGSKASEKEGQCSRPK